MGLIHHAIKSVAGVASHAIGAVKGVAHHLLGEEIEKRALTAREEVRIYLQFKFTHLTSHYTI